jgi:small-conductance mechanosensitive channel
VVTVVEVVLCLFLHYYATFAELLLSTLMTVLGFATLIISLQFQRVHQPCIYLFYAIFVFSGTPEEHLS